MKANLVDHDFDVDNDGFRFVKISHIAAVASFVKRRIARWIKRRKTGGIVLFPVFGDVEQCLAGGLEDALHRCHGDH